ncbi:phospholipase A1-like [Culex pipiens pallens]|uniref:phospholipase A1-like n=1 Tax=Culex pipiens pallens TaxID=42434 RepID=UPI001953AA5B|nr:phospholipase A1-like [Culex pipiens pallens]
MKHFISILICIFAFEELLADTFPFIPKSPNHDLLDLDLDLDDMEYERDFHGDSLIPQLLFPRDEPRNFVQLPDQSGHFEVVPRALVRECRRNASSYEAAADMKFWFYARHSADDGKPIKLDFDELGLLASRYGFRPELATKILIHGWMGSSESEVMDPLAKAYLEQGDVNVVGVDWEEGADRIWYPTARYHAPAVADVVAAMIEELVGFGQTPDLIGIVGHSLGAHIAGLAGKRTRQKIGFIVGLDPAAPLFRLEKPLERLAAGDAQYVEVIHTNGKALGIFENIGKVDIYPNGGSNQPGCEFPDLACSHQRAVEYFRESLKVKNFANRCVNVNELGERCSLGRATLGGFETRGMRSKPRGVYYMNTAESRPFLKDVKRVVAPMVPHYH